ncbi:MAG: hypothetical protein ABWX83_12775 [Luteibacter sp.]
MRTLLKTSKLGVATALIAFGFIGGGSMYLACSYFSYERSALHLILGTCGLMFAGYVVIRTIEDASVRLDDEGVVQTRIFSKGKFFVTRKMDWCAVERISSKRSVYLFQWQEFETSLSTNFFSDAREVEAFIGSRIPQKILNERLTRDVAASSKRIVPRWVGAQITLIAGVTITLDGDVLFNSGLANAWGLVLVIASLLWAISILRFSSITLTSLGIRRTLPFGRNGFLVRELLAWKDVRSMSPLSTTCKYTGLNGSVRVDASYFDDEDGAVLFANHHVPETVKIYPCWKIYRRGA